MFDFSELVAAWNDSLPLFGESISNWFSNISINSVIVMVMMLFMLWGAIDKIMGNKYGYGEQFEEGLNCMGPLAVSMAGVVAVAPLLALVLNPIIGPVYNLLGADPAMFATTLLACDMGGYPLAMQMAANEAIGNYAGLILGSMMGPTIVFTIPVALGIIDPEDRPYLGAGTLVGVVTIPVGCIVGGFVMNATTSYSLSVADIFMNMIPVVIIAAAIAAGLWFAPSAMMKGFDKFGTGVTIFITAVTAIAIFEYNTGITLPLFNLMMDDGTGVNGLESGLLTCGIIAITLAGAYPMVKFITDKFGKVLGKIGSALGMNAAGSAGMVATLANNIAMFNILKDMNPKAKVLNCAFAVSAAFVFGDHLGFCAGNNPEMITPMIVGKLVAGVLAVVLGNFLAPKLLARIPGASEK
ncbi:MAG: ethanolamine utilization protein EutH [Oscillospiraceae bacterium]|nr:ethanolamine utilization protein EutH [Oscillospiraceae bacterium]